ASLGERRGNGGTHATVARHEHAGTGQYAPLAQDAAHEAFAVEHVANERTASSEADRVARTRDLCGDRYLIQERDRRNLVRHGDKRAVDVGKLEHQLEKCGIFFGLATHRYDDRIDAVFFKVGIVDHRRLEGFGRITEVGDEFRLAAYHGQNPALMPYLR